MHRNSVIIRIREKLNAMPEGISAILYGSEARGEAHPDSDVDILLIVNRDNITEKERQDIINPLFDIEYETGVIINPVVVLKNQWGRIITPFYENVMREGLVLC
ncbi:MAG: nucleotidyltransferase domain-containing protein [Mangrovibacterium sp.]